MGTPSVQIPSGYLICDGSSYLREDYPDLFDAIKDTYGAEDDYHFNVPDFRGMFLRGAGGENSADIGLVQECAVPNITGKSGVFTYESGAGANGAITTVRSGGNNIKTADYTKAKGYFTLNASDSSPIYKDGVTEVRPINQSINWIIKY
jgi:microcystin-dependent protein